MATAEQLRGEFQRFMDAHDIKYTVIDESDNMISLIFGGQGTDTHVIVDFDEEGNNATSVQFRSEAFAECNGSIASALPAINKINSSYRWVKFWVKDDGKIYADCDALVFPGSVGEECAQIAFRMSNIIEEAIKQLQGVATVSDDTIAALRMMSLFAKLR